MFSAVGGGAEFEGTPLYVHAVLSLLEAWCSVSAACDEAWMLPGRQVAEVGRCGRYCGQLLCLCDSRRRLRRRHGGGGHLVIYIAALCGVAWRVSVSGRETVVRSTSAGETVGTERASSSVPVVYVDLAVCCATQR